MPHRTVVVEPPSIIMLMPAPPADDAPTIVREGIVRRRLAAAKGRCPCGATAPMPNRSERRRAVRERRIIRVRVEHEPACAAVHPTVVAALAEGTR